MVVTLTLTVPLPLASMFGLTVHVVAVAATGREQDKLTCDEKPLFAVTEIAFVKLAVCPAGIVCVVIPEDVIEKSGGSVTVKLTGDDVPPGVGSIT